MVELYLDMLHLGSILYSEVSDVSVCHLNSDNPGSMKAAKLFHHNGIRRNHFRDR